MGEAARSLFALLFPDDCRLCQSPLTEISRLPVCRICLESIQPIAEPICAVCGERLASPHLQDAEARCGMCRRVEHFYERAAAFAAYDGRLRELVHLLKYEHVRPAANVLGGMLAEVIARLRPQFDAHGPVVVPVPLHPGKLRQRGFNQAEAIARAALKQFPGMELGAGVMERHRATDSQTGLTRHQRRENVRGAFVVAYPEAIAARDVLLVDDVFTTGTTVSECARVLRRSGASRVFVATVARVLRPVAEASKSVEASAQQAAVA